MRNGMRLLIAFFKGLVIMLWLIISFSFGMWGYSEINTLLDIKKYEVRETMEENRSIRGTQQSQAENLSGQSPQNDAYQYDGIYFANAAELREFIYRENSANSIITKLLEKIKLANNGDVSTSVLFMLTAISYGIIGALTDQIRRIVVSKRERSRALQNGQKVHYQYILEDVSIFFRPLFGGLVGFMALGVTSLIPLILQSASEINFIRPTALLFFCFFSGLMSDEIYDWVTDLVLTFFKAKPK
jgi:hypothetical protein